MQRLLFVGCRQSASRKSGQLQRVFAIANRYLILLTTAFADDCIIYGPNVVAALTFIERYRAAWKDAPYPPTFVTTDAVVVHSGHLPLACLRAEPGKGLWALPGGFMSRTNA